MLSTYAADLVKFAAGHSPMSTYEVRIDLFFTKDQVVNKGWPKTKTYYKKMDVGNRRKLLEDCLAEVLGIDDMYTFDLRMVKQVTTGEPYVKITVQQRKHTDYGVYL